jgi:hypothetical protein
MRDGYFRVTEVLSRYSGLDKVDPEVLQKAAYRGTQVHDYIEHYVKGLSWLPPSDLVTPYFNSFLQWYTQAVESVMTVEHRFYDDEWKVTGACDLICKIRGDLEDCWTIIDYKTPQTLSKTFTLQTAAYYKMGRDEFGSNIKRRACVQLFKDGSPAYFKEYNQHDRDIKLFEQALSLHNFFRNS